MAYKARFVHGDTYFNLDAGEFDLFQDFIFPVAQEAMNATAAPTGSMTGGAVVSKTAQDRWWAWSVRIQGSTGTQTHYAARRLSAWLSGALADKSSKLYFEYTPNYISPAPVWGQHGAPYRWEVKQAIVDMDGSYYHYTIPDTILIVPISLYVGPYAMGSRQRLCMAKGGIFEEVSSATDGISRGTQVLEGTTNKSTNPVFGNATYDTNWSAGAGVAASVNTNADFVLYGTNSVYLVPIGATNRTFAQTLNVGNTNTHTITCYVKKPDSSAVTSDDCDITYGGSRTCTYTFLGNGFYRVQVSVTGVAGNTLTGLVAKTSIYFSGMQVEEKAYSTPLAYGDMIGCAWTGTAHASTSTRTAGVLKLTAAGAINRGVFSVMMAIKWRYPNTHANNMTLWANTTTTGLNAYFSAADDKIYLGDGTNSAASSALTFVENDVYILHFTVSTTNGLKIYINGAVNGTNATYTPPAIGDYLFWGSNSSGAVQSGMTILGACLYDYEMTAAQVASHYTQIHAQVDGGDGYGQRVCSLPYLWTKDGDNVVDNYTDATHNHWAVAAGIMGSTEAETEIIGTPGTAFSGLNLSNFATRRYFSPSVFFADLGGTAIADSVGGSAYVTSISTGSSSFTASGGAAVSWTKSAYPELSETEFYLLARIKDASTSYIRIQPYVASNSYAVNINSDFSRLYTTTTSYRLFRTNLGITQKNYSGYDTEAQALSVYGYRNSGTANITTDYYAMFPRPYQYCLGYKMTSFKLIGNTLVKVTDAPFSGMVEVLKTVGDIIEFTPNHYNLLQTLMGYEGENPELAYTLTYDIYYTPRYLIL